MSDNFIIFGTLACLLLVWAISHTVKERRAAAAKARRTVGDDLRDAIREADRERLKEAGAKELAEHMESYWSTRLERLQGELETWGLANPPKPIGAPPPPPPRPGAKMVPTGEMPASFAAAGSGPVVMDSHPEGAGQGLARHNDAKADESMRTFGFYRQPGE